MAITNPTGSLEHFIRAQDPAYGEVIEQLRVGRKRTHWMWFIFPQLAGLGFSEMSQRYAIRSLDEARAYLAHPVLGTRLRECTAIVNNIEGRDIHQIFGSPDDMKFHSSVTLFARAGGGDVFTRALEKFFRGEEDQTTIEFLRF